MPIIGLKSSKLAVYSKLTGTNVINTAAETDMYNFTVAASKFLEGYPAIMRFGGSYYNNSGAARTLTIRIYLDGTVCGTIAWTSIAASANLYYWWVDAIFVSNPGGNLYIYGVLGFMALSSAEVVYKAKILSVATGPLIGTDITFRISAQHSAANNNLYCTPQFVLLSRDFSY